LAVCSPCQRRSPGSCCGPASASTSAGRTRPPTRGPRGGRRAGEQAYWRPRGRLCGTSCKRRWRRTSGCWRPSLADSSSPSPCSLAFFRAALLVYRQQLLVLRICLVVLLSGLGAFWGGPSAHSGLASHAQERPPPVCFHPCRCVLYADRPAHLWVGGLGSGSFCGQRHCSCVARRGLGAILGGAHTDWLWPSNVRTRFLCIHKR